MDAILALVAVFVGIALVRWLLSAGVRTVGAAAKAAVGKGSFSDNMELAFKGMVPFEVRCKDSHLGDGHDGPLVKEIEGRGLFPVTRTTRIRFVTSVFDKTSGELEPMLSSIEAFQESDSIVYQHSGEIGSVSENQGFLNWVRLGVVLPEILQPPYGGNRQLLVILRMVDLDNPPDIEHGFHERDPKGLIWQGNLEFTYSFSEKGYKEAAEHRDEARTLAVKIGIAVAMADGSLDDEEGEIIRHWILRAVAPFSEERQKYLKKSYNDAMREAYSAAKNQDLSLSNLTARLNEVGERRVKYEAVELCFDVMAADGVADAEEVKIIRKIALALDLDFAEIEKMRDQRIIGLDSRVSDQAGIDDLLGIEPSWDVDRIKGHLRAEFHKWNNRITTLSEGEERDNAQRMLNLIAEARKKYG